MGRVCVEAFKAASWYTVSVDRYGADDAAHSVVIKGEGKDDAATVLNKIKELKLTPDAVISVAGGWVGGHIKDPLIFDELDKMWRFNVISSVVASHIAAHTLAPGGLLVLTGALAALDEHGTPGMIAYGLSKAATHHLLESVAQPGQLSAGSIACAIAPVMLDTKTNREAMPDADRSTWTPLTEVANKLVTWASGAERPPSGAVVAITTKDHKTAFTHC